MKTNISEDNIFFDFWKYNCKCKRENIPNVHRAQLPQREREFPPSAHVQASWSFGPSLSNLALSIYAYNPMKITYFLQEKK